MEQASISWRVHCYISITLSFFSTNYSKTSMLGWLDVAISLYGSNQSETEQVKKQDSFKDVKVTVTNEENARS